MASACIYLICLERLRCEPKKQMCFEGSLCKASRLGGGCCALFFFLFFLSINVILMLWIVICEPESAWGWSTCCEED